MSKTINNYKGRHHGWKQRKATKTPKKRTGISPIQFMWIKYAAKSAAFMKARNTLRDKLNVKGKKALTGAKRQKVLDKFFALGAA